VKSKLNPNKTCANIECKKKFAQQRPLQMVCSPTCGYAYQKQQRDKKEDEQWKETKKVWKSKHKNHSDYVQDAQKIFNEFIRIRDKNEPCISCDAEPSTYKLTAGHFYPSTYAYLRLNEDNVNSQCWFNCNKNRHGNLSEYRPRLIKKIGLERVEKLDEDRLKPFRLSIPELIELKVIYKDKIRKLQKNELGN